MRSIKLLLVLGAVLLFALPAGSVRAAPGDLPDRILPGEDYRLRAGETESGDVVVLGGSAEIEAEAVLDGNLAVFGGDVVIAGTVEGDVTAFGGRADILGTARIAGDCVAIGGDLQIDQAAEVDGEVVTSPGGVWWPLDRLAIPFPRVTPWFVHRYPSRAAGRVASALVSAVIIGAASLFIASVWPQQVSRARRVIVRQPVASGLVGLLTFAAAGLLTPVLLLLSLVLTLVCIGLLGFPLIALLWLAVGAASMFGWAALGQLAGRWMSARLSLEGMTFAKEAGLGAFALGLALGLIEVVPFFCLGGGLLHFCAVCLGLGAAALTRFGNRDYPDARPVPPADGMDRGGAGPELPAASSAGGPQVTRGEERPESGFEAPQLESKGPFPEQ